MSNTFPYSLFPFYLSTVSRSNSINSVI